VSPLELVFGGFSVLAVAGGLLAVTSPRVVHCALWLVVSLGAVAGVYLCLGAEVVALVQLLVYVGAVVVLVLFALMLTRAPIGVSRELSTSTGHRVLAAGVGAATSVLLLAVLMPLATLVERTPTGTDALAKDLFGPWVWPFELLSLLLLAALVGALAVSRLRREDAE
jgi:NADH-quinone oxidoreductase subunit J